jgi:glycosyltransferase involved in cell wall biosynthesis
MTIFIIDTINNIPSHKQFQDLAVALVARGHKVIQFSDTVRPHFGGIRVVCYSNANKCRSFNMFFREFRKNKTDVVISTFRGSMYADILSYFFKFNWIAFHQSDFYHQKFYTSFQFRKVSNYLGVSSPMLPKIESMYTRLKGGIGYINNSFEFVEVNSYPKSNVILHVGGATKNAQGKFVKGTDVLIAAFNQCAQNEGFTAELWIVGDGPDLDELKEAAGSNSLIKFTGRVSNAEVHKLMKQSKLFVLPSRNEAFGQVFLEAMQYGCSLIGTASTGAVDIIEVGDFGSIVPQENVNALAKAMQDLNEKYSFIGAVEAYKHKRIQFGRAEWVSKMIQIIEVK